MFQKSSRILRAFQVAQWSRIHLQCRRHGFHPLLGRSPGKGNGNPLSYSCLGNPTDTGACTWGATVHGVTEESDMA